ncbi:hypothetical protein AVEN_206748-1 [Araneus ventricosus]|uniref:Uncharacterized protein n=1 Tax=Araneus ventricosus TaxID=182803 RepID=A0A4Y2C5G6_ARAVE|nr:hypothetical protein AVEN_206748-1 [Araneus ventricosus]
MLVHLHSAGNIHYAKSAHLYLQSMSNLKTSLSDQEFERFVSEGYFTVRRSDKFCALDLHHSGKSSGDGTVEAFDEVKDESSDQYISSSKLWQTRNTSDLKKFLIWLKQHSPFNQSEDLISLSSGIVVDDKVNCDSAEELGENAAKGMVGKRFTDVTFKRKMQVFTLAAMENTKLIYTDPVVFNLNQLFHRIACVLRSADDLEGCLQYEWAPYIHSLFDDVALRAGRRRF